MSLKNLAVIYYIINLNVVLLWGGGSHYHHMPPTNTSFSNLFNPLVTDMYTMKIAIDSYVYRRYKTDHFINFNFLKS